MANDHVDITRRGYVFDSEHDDGIYCIESIKVEDGETVRTVHDLTGLTSPEPDSSKDKAVALWEVRGQIARANLRTKLRRIPEARRRAEERRIAQQQRQQAAQPFDVCPSCHGSGWIDDEQEGRGYYCPSCRPGHS
jgi:hypothetical protein